MSLPKLKNPDPLEESRKHKDLERPQFPPKEAKQIAPGVYQDRHFIYVGDKL